MANNRYTRIFGIQDGELNSWSMRSDDLKAKYGDAYGYASYLMAQKHVHLIAFEENEISLLDGPGNRINHCVQAIRDCNTFLSWFIAVPNCEELQIALSEAGIDLGGPGVLMSAGPRKPKPIICPEIWRTKPFDPAEAWAATMQACKGRGTR